MNLVFIGNWFWGSNIDAHTWTVQCSHQPVCTDAATIHILRTPIMHRLALMHHMLIRPCTPKQQETAEGTLGVLNTSQLSLLLAEQHTPQG